MMNDYLNKIKTWNEQNKTWFWGGIGGVILTLIITVAITIYSNSSKQQNTSSIIDNRITISGNNNAVEQSKGVSIDGNVVVSGDSAITGYGDIHINKIVSNSSDRILSIQKRLRNLQSQDPVINYLIQKAKNAFYSNNLDETEKFLKEIDLKQRTNP